MVKTRILSKYIVERKPKFSEKIVEKKRICQNIVERKCECDQSIMVKNMNLAKRSL